MHVTHFKRLLPSAEWNETNGALLQQKKKTKQKTGPKLKKKKRKRIEWKHGGRKFRFRPAEHFHVPGVERGGAGSDFRDLRWWYKNLPRSPIERTDRISVPFIQFIRSAALPHFTMKFVSGLYRFDHLEARPELGDPILFCWTNCFSPFQFAWPVDPFLFHGKLIVCSWIYLIWQAIVLVAVMISGSMAYGKGKGAGHAASELQLISSTNYHRVWNEPKRFVWSKQIIEFFSRFSPERSWRRFILYFHWKKKSPSRRLIQKKSSQANHNDAFFRSKRSTTWKSSSMVIPLKIEPPFRENAVAMGLALWFLKNFYLSFYEMEQKPMMSGTSFSVSYGAAPAYGAAPVHVPAPAYAAAPAHAPIHGKGHGKGQKKMMLSTFRRLVIICFFFNPHLQEWLRKSITVHRFRPHSK